MYRLEIDALNALVAEQKRTNELLELLINKQESQQPTTQRKVKDNANK